ncbi:NUDIX hydrolase [Arthrobacter sp. CAN_A212]|uniref:NUDIX hydrolase n=1 Tax=Arthrobacter sp. CAN_A212 TaxID=2787719 RepID=UPI002FEF9948
MVAVCVQREDGAVLLTQRAADKEFAFGWEFPGGSALAGESSRNAASRELREESGLDVLPSTLTLIDRFVETSAVLDFYVVRATSNAEVTLQQSEVMAAEWVPPAEVLRRLNAGAMADPWIARLDSLWPSTTLALSIVP